MFAYIETYAVRVESPEEKDKRSQKARELYQYLYNNREGLVPYQKREIRIPEPPEGMVYKGMGIQESQNCTVITLRMKEIIETLSAAKAPKKEGKGSTYMELIKHHMSIIDAMQTVSRKAF